MNVNEIVTLLMLSIVGAYVVLQGEETATCDPSCAPESDLGDGCNQGTTCSPEPTADPDSGEPVADPAADPAADPGEPEGEPAAEGDPGEPEGECWLECSEACGPGIQTQCTTEITRPCNERDCVECVTSDHTEFGEWTCSCPTESGSPRTEFRTLAVTTPGDNPSVSCVSQLLARTSGYTHTDGWYTYDASSETVKHIRSNDQCDCLPDCTFSTEWTAWTPCTPRCGPGEQTRTRVIDQRGSDNCTDPNVNGTIEMSTVTTHDGSEIDILTHTSSCTSDTTFYGGPCESCEMDPLNDSTWSPCDACETTRRYGIRHVGTEYHDGSDCFILLKDMLDIVNTEGRSFDVPSVDGEVKYIQETATCRTPECEPCVVEDWPHFGDCDCATYTKTRSVDIVRDHGHGDCLDQALTSDRVFDTPSSERITRDGNTFREERECTSQEAFLSDCAHPGCVIDTTDDWVLDGNERRRQITYDGRCLVGDLEDELGVGTYEYTSTYELPGSITDNTVLQRQDCVAHLGEVSQELREPCPENDCVLETRENYLNWDFHPWHHMGAYEWGGTTYPENWQKNVRIVTPAHDTESCVQLARDMDGTTDDENISYVVTDSYVNKIVYSVQDAQEYSSALPGVTCDDERANFNEQGVWYDFCHRGAPAYTFTPDSPAIDAGCAYTTISYDQGGRCAAADGTCRTDGTGWCLSGNIPETREICCMYPGAMWYDSHSDDCVTTTMDSEQGAYCESSIPHYTVSTVAECCDQDGRDAGNVWRTAEPVEDAGDACRTTSLPHGAAFCRDSGGNPVTYINSIDWCCTDWMRGQGYSWSV